MTKLRVQKNAKKNIHTHNDIATNVQSTNISDVSPDVPSLRKIAPFEFFFDAHSMSLETVSQKISGDVLAQEETHSGKYPVPAIFFNALR
ncbi:hypothetical protein HZ99_03705 [Pseudomonas fluorescens]|nr:hypothetical protein HZ99_03705 [Pseudomonas fluorescens]